MKAKTGTKISFMNFSMIITCIFVFGLLMKSSAQTKTVKKSSQEWIQYYNQSKISGKWIWSIDAGYRWNELLKNPYQYVVRTSIGYQLNSHIRLAAGFAHLGFYTSGKLSKVEYRPYEEFVMNDKYSNLAIQHRFRVEERYFKNVVDGNVQHGSNFNFRFRYQLMMNVKILSLSSAKPDRMLSLNVGDEIFINAGKEIVYNVFDQNRFLTGLGVSFTKDFTIAMMYNNQFAATNVAHSYNHTNIFWLTIRQNTDLTRHKKQT